jgi:snurportin-1
VRLHLGPFLFVCFSFSVLNTYHSRFWWRDTRLAELPRSLPPSNPTISSPIPLASTSGHPPYPTELANAYHFPYPISFLPIPYHTNTALSYLSSHVIPLTRSLRLVSVDVPITPSSEGIASTMDVDNSLPPPPMLTSLPVELTSDGLLLYVSQACYEPGTSPLSSWIPITGYTEGHDSTHSNDSDGPLDLFERPVVPSQFRLSMS